MGAVSAELEVTGEGRQRRTKLRIQARISNPPPARIAIGGNGPSPGLTTRPHHVGGVRVVRPGEEEQLVAVRARA